MNNEKLWLIEGYLLGDPTIDRNEFEQQMLDDPNFALQVAEISERLELLSKVAKRSCYEPAVSLARSNQLSRSNQYSRPVLFVVMAVAACLLVALIPVFSQRRERRLDDLALNWLALESEVSTDHETSTPITIAITDSEVAEPQSSSSSPTPLANDNPSTESTSSEDWLLDTAVIFFSDSGL